jgi:hypothetical protein
MGRLFMDTARASYEVSTDPEPKYGLDRKQKYDRETEQPMWTVGLYVTMPATATTKQTGEVINVTIVSPTVPQVSFRQPVIPVDLEALPWTSEREGKTRSGVAFRASGLRPIEVPSK